jgi:HSP20 family molecular chaperone IbpA
MTTFQLLTEHSPFDILVRNFFQDSGTYAPLQDSKIAHPVDIYETDSNLIFEIACTGISKNEIKILTQSNILRVNYDKGTYADKELQTKQYLYKGIARRSFNLGWKVDSKFDLTKAEATFADGLLTVKVPYSKGSELKTLQIK